MSTFPKPSEPMLPRNCRRSLERWPAAWRNHNPYSDRILTSTSRQIKKSRVSHSDSDFFHLNLSLNRKSPNHQTKKKSSRSFRFRLQITDERVRVMSKNRCFAKQKRRFWSHHSAGHQSFSLYIFRRSAIAARPAICKSSNKQSTRNTTDELRRATEVTVRPPRRRPDAPARASARTAA